jgi:hypothetical protein
MVKAYAGLVRFGLMAFATQISKNGTPAASCNAFVDAPGANSTADSCAVTSLHPAGSCGASTSSACCDPRDPPPGSGPAPWSEAAWCTGTPPWG